MKPFSRLFFGIATLGALSGLTACSSGSSSSFDQLANSPHLNKAAWYNASAQICSVSTPAPGCDFWWTGRKLLLTEDPAYSQIGGIVINRARNSGESDKITVAGVTYIPENQSFVKVGGWTFQAQLPAGSFTWRIFSPSGVEYDVDGNAVNFVGAERAHVGGRDILASKSEQEAASVAVIQSGLQAKYGLDDGASLNMAKVIAQDIKRPSNRGYTDVELDALTSQMYNVHFGDMKRVYQQATAGNVAEAEALADQLIVPLRTPTAQRLKTCAACWWTFTVTCYNHPRRSSDLGAGQDVPSSGAENITRLQDNLSRASIIALHLSSSCTIVRAQIA